MKIRKASFAGKFYPATENSLRNLIETIRSKEFPNIEIQTNEIIGGIVPHAGYIYSGYQAIHFFENISKAQQKFDTIIILHPNHTGYGSNISLDTNEVWQTPLGNVKIDLDFSKSLQLPYNESAHIHEHSGEVMIPFLQYFLPYPFQIVPICILQQNYSNSLSIAEKIQVAIKKSEKKVLVIASSDFSHFLSPETGKKLDDKVIEAILQFNSSAVEKVIKKYNISVCGFAPIMSLLEFATKTTTSPQIKLLKRGHSGDIYPSDEVVNYASFLVCK